MAGTWAYLDGEFCPLEEARIPITDPGFTRGDAVYDTTSVWRGSFFRLLVSIVPAAKEPFNRRAVPSAAPGAA